MVTAENPPGGSLPGRLARLGFRDVDATAATLERLGLDEPAVLYALARAADPDLALRTFERLVDACPEATVLIGSLQTRDGLRRRLTAVLGASSALGEFLIRHPLDWHVLDDEAAMIVCAKPAALRAALLEAVGADPADPAPLARDASAATIEALRAAYHRALLIVAARDLDGATELGEVMAELADLAAAALDGALAIARADLPPSAPPVRLAIVGMGKCGARELNYVSDVDVVFVAEPPAGEAGPEPADAALRIATRLAAAVIAICGGAGAEGRMFPVDAGLRPEGRDGALVRTLASHEAYYRRWASGWEYQALIKARAVAGDIGLGTAYTDLVAPMVWSAASRENFVPEVWAMRRRVEASLPPAVANREIKLGPGGLRDVEFAVQLLQLVHGRTDDTLREPATLPALEALAAGGYIGRRDAAGLGESYRFLRTVEHRLQLQQLRRTHSLPADEDGLRWTGRGLGYRGAADFAADQGRHARQVRRLHEKLFYRPLLDAVARIPIAELHLSQASAGLRLRALGFQDPEAALRHLQHLSTGVSRTAAIQRTLLPAMLGWFADAADPDAGLLAYRQVSDALGRTPWYLRLLRDEERAAARFAQVLAGSAYVSQLMIRSPETVQLLSSDDELRPHGREQVTQSLRAVGERHADPAEAIAAVRAVRRVELLRVACADLVGLLDVRAVGVALSDALIASIDAVLQTAVRGREQRHGPLPIRFAVIAVGRLGGWELSYGSDADVLFVHEALPGVSEEAANNAARDVAADLRRLASLPAPDPPILIDASLRPEGRQGPLVRSLGSYAAYYRRWSLGWEAQALLRAAPLAGDAGLTERFLHLADESRYPARLPPGAVAEVQRLRARMEAERIPRGVEPALHLKLGPGGLTDVEWTVQLLQLRHAAAHPALRTTSTLDGLAAAAREGFLDAEQEKVLSDAWITASRIRNAVVLTSGRPGDVIPRARRPLGQVARLVGYPADDPGSLLEDYRRAGRGTRELVEGIFAREREES